MKRLLLLFIALCLVCGCFTALAQSKTVPPYRDTLFRFAELPRNQPEVTIVARDYLDTDMADLKVLADGSLFTGDEGQVDFLVEVPETALYTIHVTYQPVPSMGGDIQRAILINGSLPFAEAGEIVFSRQWGDISQDYKQVAGNQPFPSQVETPAFATVPLKDAMGYEVEPLLFRFEQGSNILSFKSLRQAMLIRDITLSQARQLPDYDTYLQGHLEAGAREYAGSPVKIQAEDAILKSSPSFYPVNDRTSPLTEPYHPSYIVLNTIGGTAWNEPGEWITWEVEVPEDGLYRIVTRFSQSEMRGLYAARQLSINGEIPFKEAADLRFYHGTGFQLQPLGAHRADPARAEDTAAYWFYFTKGTHRLTLEMSLGELGQVLRKLEQVIGQLNSLYRQIVSITGSVPDVYRDYLLYTRVPGLARQTEERLIDLRALKDELLALTGQSSEYTAGLTRLIATMEAFDNDSEEVVKRLSPMKESISAVGKALLDMKNQPLKLDYLLLAGEDLGGARAEGNVLEKALHTVLSFAGSFSNDYSVAGALTEETGKELEVWLSTGRDQYDVIRRLVNESYENQYGTKVNIKLISPDVMLPSIMTGRGPDLTIQIANTAPVNFAFRGAALDLTEFPDYEEVAAAFLPAAMTSFLYQDGVYALPDQMSFPVMYYRSDILDALGLQIPETWEDLVALIPQLQRNNMEIYLDTAPPASLGTAVSMGSGKPVNTIFLSRLFQTGGELYQPDGRASDLNTAAAYEAFKFWTQFYTQHGFPLEMDFVTRFRIGEVPLGIVDLSTYTRLAVSAPEIKGAWSIAQVPGTRDEKGRLVRAVPAVTGACMIVKNSVEARGRKQEAWDFLKWWTSAQTQLHYAREMETVLGQAGRYLVANLEAFDTVAWPPQVTPVLKATLPTLRGIPQVPGGYITGRYLDNAFVTVITKYENTSDTLYDMTRLIDEEIAAKRAEFQLDEEGVKK